MKPINSIRHIRHWEHRRDASLCGWGRVKNGIDIVLWTLPGLRTTDCVSRTLALHSPSTKGQPHQAGIPQSSAKVFSLSWQVWRRWVYCLPLPLLFVSLFNEDGETLGLLKSFRLASAVCNYCGRKSLNAWHTFLISGDLRSYFYLMWAWHYSLFRNSFGNTEVFHSHITFPVHRGTWETLCNYLSGEWQVKGIFKIIAIIISLTPS